MPQSRTVPEGKISAPIPGELLLHPVLVVSAVALVVNDQYLKSVWPGPITGKLSDFAGLIVFPVLLASLAEFARAMTRRPVVVESDSWLWPTICAIGFTLTKCTSAVNDAYAWVIGTVRWPYQLLTAIAQGDTSPSIQPILVARDTTDLLALMVLAVPYILLRARFANSGKRLI